MPELEPRLRETELTQAQVLARLVSLETKADSLESKVDSTRELVIELRESFKFTRRILVPIFVAVFIAFLAVQLGLKT